MFFLKAEYDIIFESNMMNHFKKQLAFLLVKSSKRGLNALDPKSPCAKALKSKDIELLISKDIEKICEAAFFGEISKILTLYAWFRIASQEKRDELKDEFKTIADGIIERVEERHGKLNIPDPCRDLLINL